MFFPKKNILISKYLQETYIFLSILLNLQPYNWPSNSVGTQTKLIIQNTFMRRRRRYLKVLCVQFRPFSQRISKLYRRLYQFSKVCFESFEAAILQKSREHLILMVVFSGSVGHNAWIACIKDVKESSPEVFWTSHLRSIYVERLGENNVISCDNVIRQVSVKWKGRNILLTCIIKLNIPLIISTDEQFIIIMNN